MSDSFLPFWITIAFFSPPLHPAKAKASSHMVTNAENNWHRGRRSQLLQPSLHPTSGMLEARKYFLLQNNNLITQHFTDAGGQWIISAKFSKAVDQQKVKPFLSHFL